MKKQRKPKALDLFSGCGGLSLGLRQAGFEVVGAVELNPAANETYKLNHPKTRLWEADITTLSAAAVRRELKLKVGELDLLAGCPPCQGFSALRTRNGSEIVRDSRNSLVGQMLTFAREFSPKTVMMENVPKLSKHKPFKELCRGLREEGYHLKFEVKDAANFGVPQRRKRLILLASKNLGLSFPKPSSRAFTVRHAIGGLRKPGRSNDPLHDLPMHPRSERVLRLISDIPKDGGSRRDLADDRQLPCHIRSDGYRDVYGRMAWDEPAPTITSGCTNPSKGRFLHPRDDRAITLREAALLQGFPKSYLFNVPDGKVVIALMIGNALPPEFIRRHAAAIRRALQGSVSRIR